MSLIDRIKENKPLYDPRVRANPKILLEPQEKYQRPPEQYKWYQLAIAAAPWVIGGTAGLGAAAHYFINNPKGQEIARNTLETITALFN